jgi:shikimate 5-dehydrogenase
MCIGAGGAAVAISVFVAGLAEHSDRPRKFIAINRSEPRLRKMREVHAKLKTDIDFEYILNDDPARNDAIMANLPPGSMVINATGMGKDRPGSPITNNGDFPQGGLVWELNYRGDLDFLGQARSQEDSRNLVIEDGWVYFVHGWSDAISRVFAADVTSETFNALEEAAATVRS